MNDFIDAWLSPGVWLLAGWSLRWGLLIALVALWFALRAPRHAATRDVVWHIVLVAGLILLASGTSMFVAIPTPAVTPEAATRAVSEPPARPASPRAADAAAASAAKDRSRQSDARRDDVAATAAPQPKAPRAPLNAARLAIVMLAGAWIAGVCWRVLGLMVAGCRLVRLVHTAITPSQAALRQFETCRRVSGVRARVTLKMHPEVVSPMLVCGPPRCILVPDHWQSLSEATQQAVLLHELAHVARHDDVTKVLEELVRVLFFFHPLVHYLLNRLDSDREEVCDATALRQGVSPRVLAGVLLDYSRRMIDQRQASGAVLPFFRPRTLKHRIMGLLDYRWADGGNQGPSSVQRFAACWLAIVLLFVCRGVALRAANPLAARPPTDSLTVIEGQLVDIQGRALKSATVSVVYAPFPGVFLTSPSATTDDLGLFRLSPESDTVPFRVGEIGMFLVTAAEGLSYEANVVIQPESLLVHVPTLLNARVERIDNVAVGELAGVIVDELGKPLPGVLVNEGYAHKGHETTTDAKGQFRLKGFERDEKVEVIISKPGYSPETFMQQPTGVDGWVVALGSKMYFEGTVRGPDGTPAAGAKVRANQGPKDGSGFRRSELWTETKADNQGRYRLYVQPDAYEIAVDAAGVGVAHLDKRPIGYGQVEVLDVDLTPGVTFVAHFVDAATGQPVPGVRIRHWQNKKVTGTSDAQGNITLTDMLPGRVEIDLKAPGYARWWSDEAMSPWNHKTINKPELNWQRNFDYLDFDVSNGMAPVTIEMEKAVRIRGRVVDPDGQPVGGATAAPALTGTGNSLTGDTRFSVKTKADGTFEMWLPASNDAEYNLVAHDGGYQQWRHWANGVLPPMQTTPGQEINGVEIRLTRPATVRGRVVDEKGKPVAFRDVRAHAADKWESRYYDPTTKTKEDGTFELSFIRPGEQFIQAAPFWLTAEQAPDDSTKAIVLESGQTVDGVELVGHAER